MITIRPFRLEEAKELNDAAAADNHTAVTPTQVIRNSNGEIIGCLSVGAIPTVHFWMDSKKAKARDTKQVVEFYENLLAGAGHSWILVPCVASSPLRGYMDKYGYLYGATSDLMFKLLT